MRTSLTVLFAALPLLAHHSFSAEFDATKSITLTGVVTRVDWANPHVYFFVDVKDSKGAVVNYACETDGPNALIRRGWKRDSLKAGDQIMGKVYDGETILHHVEIVAVTARSAPGA